MPDRLADRPPGPFTAAEHELIRREMAMRFGQHLSLADGLFLRAWRGGARKSPRRSAARSPPSAATAAPRGSSTSTPRATDGPHGYNVVRNDGGRIVFVRRLGFAA